MSGLGWDPPALAAVLLGIAAVATWLVVAPPERSVRGALRASAALLLVLALLDVGCQRVGTLSQPRAVVLVDRSLSMTVGGREHAAEGWIARLDGALAGWRVERDSFGGATTDLAEAIARVETRLPDAIVVVSDGRAAGGRAAEPPAVRLYAHAPAPLALEDLAVVDIAIHEGEGSASAEVETAAVGGVAAPARALVVLVDGRPAARAPAGAPLVAGERRMLRVPLGRLPARAVVEARLEGADAVAGNDRRVRVTGPGTGPRAALLVALRPGWEFGFMRRALEAAVGAPVETYWTPAAGRLAPLDRAGSLSWSAISPDRYRTVWLFGDPALLGETGSAWIERFAARGGRGIFWAPGGHAGRLAGAGPSGIRDGNAAPARTAAPPALTEAGRRWLVAHGGPSGAAPDGTSAWPPLELLPAEPPDLTAGAIPLLTAAGHPAAWVVERGANRVAVFLGTGYYRWQLAGEEGARGFWNGWVTTLARWLAGAASADRPLVRMPPGGRVARGAPLEAEVAVTEDLAWRIQRDDRRGAGAEVAARGEVRAGEGERVLRAGPLEPGVYRLIASAGKRRMVEPFVVETWAPDLAWTASDTASLAEAARMSGGAFLGPEPRIPIPPPRAEIAPARTFGLGTTPWTYLAAALLLLLDWGYGRALTPRDRAG